MDYQIPFNPATMWPTTEVRASIDAHAPMPYVLRSIDVPQPNYNELQQKIGVTEEIEDPRYQKIRRLPIASSAAEAKLPNFSIFGVPSVPAPESIELPGVAPVFDPISPLVINPAAQQPCALPERQNAPPRIEISSLLRDSEWYMNLTTTEKLTTNRHLSIVALELNSFQANPDPKKRLDLDFIRNNNFLQKMLTNLGVRVSDAGMFERLPILNVQNYHPPAFQTSYPLPLPNTQFRPDSFATTSAIRNPNAVWPQPLAGAAGGIGQHNAAKRFRGNSGSRGGHNSRGAHKVKRCNNDGPLNWSEL